MIGDINSSERGSGARFNDGKAPVQYLLWGIAAEWLTEPDLRAAAAALGRFQRDRNADHLHELVRVLYPHRRGALIASAEVFRFGAEKYAPWNWAKGMPWSVPLACIGRHLIAEDKGEYLDPESGLPHRAHVVCNVFMLLHYLETYPEGDDLPALEMFKRPEAEPGDDYVVIAGCQVPVSAL